MSRLRDAEQREERSDYGGERIEAAATDGARLAARSVEAFLKFGAMALSRNKGEEQPPDDLPFDETVPQETAPGTEAAPVAEELPATECPPLPECAESPALPEHPAPETAAELPSAGRISLPQHPVISETSVAEEQATEPEDRQSKRRSRRDGESASTERTEEDSWRPAYKDAEPDVLRRPATVLVRKAGGATEPPKGVTFHAPASPTAK